MTCLIIFSGSSARSTMSFRFARINVLTRSKSPMMHLLSNNKTANFSRHQKNAAAYPLPSKTRLRQQVQAANPRRKLHQPRQRNQAERDCLLKCPYLTTQKVVKQESDRHHHENPNNEKSFFHVHGHPPGPSGAPVDPPRPTGTEAIVMTCWPPAFPASVLCPRSNAPC